MFSEPMIAVRDVPASVRWYCDVLGCRSDHGGTEFDRLVDGEEVLLMLHQLEAPEHALLRDPALPAGNGFVLWIYVPDLAVVAEQARVMGATVVKTPHDNPQAGCREMTLEDPDGFRVVAAQRLR